MSTLTMNKPRAFGPAALLLLCMSARAGEAAPPPSDPAATAMRQSLVQRYPNTRFGDVRPSAVPGLWEVRMGANIAYASNDGRYFLFGHLFDMQTQTDLTPAVQRGDDQALPAARPALSFTGLPLDDAIRTVRGTGERKVAVFADPLCPHCRSLEQTLARLDNVTVYTFLLPRQEAQAAATAIWCAPDRAASWSRYMRTGLAPKQNACATPLARIASLAAEAGINGTPYLVFANGGTAAGTPDAARLEQLLSNHPREPR